MSSSVVIGIFGILCVVHVYMYYRNRPINITDQVLQTILMMVYVILVYTAAHHKDFAAINIEPSIYGEELK